MKRLLLLLAANVAVFASLRIGPPGGMSLNPYFSPEDLVDDAQLVSWIKGEGVKLERRASGNYIACEAAAKAECWNFHSFRRGSALFVDVQQRASGHVIAPHYVFRVDKRGADIEMIDIDATQLKRLVKSGALKLATVQAEGAEIITAPTSELRKFLQTHASNPQVFEARNAKLLLFRPAPLETTEKEIATE